MYRYRLVFLIIPFIIASPDFCEGQAFPGDVLEDAYNQEPDGNNQFNVVKTREGADGTSETIIATETDQAEDMELTLDGTGLVIGDTRGKVSLVLIDGSSSTVLLEIPNVFIQGVAAAKEGVYATYSDQGNGLLAYVPYGSPGVPVTVADDFSFPQDTDFIIFCEGDPELEQGYNIIADGDKLIIRDANSSDPNTPNVAEITLPNGGAVKFELNADGTLVYSNFDKNVYLSNIFNPDPNTGKPTSWINNPTSEVLVTEENSIKGMSLTGDRLTYTTGDKRKVLDITAKQVIKTDDVDPTTIAVASHSCEAAVLKFEPAVVIARPDHVVPLDVQLSVPDGQTVAGAQLTIASECEADCGINIKKDVINDLPDGWSIVTQKNEDGSVNVVVVNLNGEHLGPGTYTLLEALLEADESVSPDHSENISLKNTVLSDKDSKTLTCVVTKGGTIQIAVPADVAGGFHGDGDGQVDVTDAVKIIKYVIGKIPLPDSEHLRFRIDANGDLQINVGDVVFTIKIMMDNQDNSARITASPINSASMSLGALSQLEDSRKAIPVIIKSDGTVAGFQAAFAYDPTMMEIERPALTGAAGSMSLDYHVENGRLMLAAFSMDGRMIPAGEAVAVLIPVTLTGEGPVDAFTLENAIIADAFASVIPTALGETALKLPVAPNTFALMPNTPNPFNPSTTINYEIPLQMHVTLTVYNVLGQEVVHLVDRVQTAGRYSVVWNARNSRGEAVSSGVYMYRLTTDAGHNTTRRMVLLK